MTFLEIWKVHLGSWKTDEVQAWNCSSKAVEEKLGDIWLRDRNPYNGSL